MLHTEVAEDKPNETFTSLIHLINEQAIKGSHYRNNMGTVLVFVKC